MNDDQRKELSQASKNVRDLEEHLNEIDREIYAGNQSDEMLDKRNDIWFLVKVAEMQMAILWDEIAQVNRYQKKLT